jgi:hypothetical protein
MTNEKKLSEETLRLLMQSLGESILAKRTDPRGVVSVLISETTRFRDKLKAETGTVLTVGDTREALNGLEAFMNTGQIPPTLSSEQRSLTQIWIDRLTTFK